MGFAHRGLHGGTIPENSLASFAAAIAIGAGVECDVRLSGNGTAMVVHDPDLRRLCSVALEVENTPAALLAGQRLAETDQYIPSLEQFLELVGNRAPGLIELKIRDHNFARLCREVLSDLAPRDGRMGVMSFDPRVGRWLKNHAPLTRRGLVIRDSLSPLKRWIAMKIASPHFLSVDVAALGRPWVARARKTMPVYSWTIRTPAERAVAAPLADALIWEADGRPGA